jgi:hypothetical protein
VKDDAAVSEERTEPLQCRGVQIREAPLERRLAFLDIAKLAAEIASLASLRMGLVAYRILASDEGIQVG